MEPMQETITTMVKKDDVEVLQNEEHEMDRGGKEEPSQGLKSKVLSKGKQYASSLVQIDQLGASNISNSILKAIVNFFIYMSYALLIMAVILIVIAGPEQRQSLVNYVIQENNHPFIIALVIIAVTVIIIYRNFKKNSLLEPNVRKFLNFCFDWSRVLFHIVFLIFMHPYVMNTPKKGIQYAFWTLVIGELFQILRAFLKWVHFYCGTGKDNLESWKEPFKFDDRYFEKHFKELKQIKQKVESAVKSKKGGIKSMAKAASQVVGQATGQISQLKSRVINRVGNIVSQVREQLAPLKNAGKLIPQVSQLANLKTHVLQVNKKEEI